MQRGAVRTAQRLLRAAEYLSAPRPDGAGAHPVSGATALPGARRMGPPIGAGPHSRSEDVARETENPVLTRGEEAWSALSRIRSALRLRPWPAGARRSSA